MKLLLLGITILFSTTAFAEDPPVRSLTDFTSSQEMRENETEFRQALARCLPTSSASCSEREKNIAVLLENNCSGADGDMDCFVDHHASALDVGTRRRAAFEAAPSQESSPGDEEIVSASNPVSEEAATGVTEQTSATTGSEAVVEGEAASPTSEEAVAAVDASLGPDDSCSPNLRVISKEGFKAYCDEVINVLVGNTDTAHLNVFVDGESISDSTIKPHELDIINSRATPRIAIPTSPDINKCEDQDSGYGIASLVRNGTMSSDDEQSYLRRLCLGYIGTNCSREVNSYNTENPETKRALVDCYNRGGDRAFEDVAHKFELTCKSYVRGMMFGTNCDPDSIDDRMYTSHDGKYSCQRVSELTADYLSCKRMLILYDSAKVSEQGAMMGMGIQQNLNDARVQGQYATQTAQGNGQLGAVDAIRDTAVNRRNQETAKMSIFSTQAAVFTAMVLRYVTPDNYVRKCGDEVLCDYLMDMGYNQRSSGRGPSIAQQLFPNQAVRAAFVGEVAKATGETIKATILMNNYRKQAKAAGDIKEDMLNYQPDAEENPRFDANPCRLNPSLAGCQIGRGPRVSNGSAFSFSGASEQGGGGQYDLNSGGATIGEYNEGNRALRDREAIEDLGNLMNNNSPSRVNKDFNAPAGARVTSGAMRAASGLGSSGAGGGAGGGAGSSGAPAEGDGAGAANVRQASNLQFGNGAAGAAAGSKSNNSRRDSGQNPFANMFGKDKGASRNTASVIEKDIHTPNIQLFEKISERYDTVKRQNRLMNVVRE